MTAAVRRRRPGRHPASWGGFGLVPDLLAARLRMVVNAALRAGPERRGWAAVLTVAAAGVMVAGYRVAGGLLDISDPEPAALEPVVAGLCGIVAGFTAVTAITFALGSLYFARDLEPLLASPLPPRSVLLSRLATQLATGLAVGGLLAGGPLAAYLLRHGALAALPWMGICLLGLAALPLAAGTALTVVVVRLLPARQVRDAAGMVVTAVVFLVSAVNLAVRGLGGFTHSPGALDPARQGGVADAAWLPTGWAARSMVASMQGDAPAALLWGLPLVVGGAVILVAVARVLEEPLVTGFQRSLEAARRPRPHSVRSAVTGRGRRPVWLAIARKDLRETVRDLGQLGQLVLPLALFAVYVVSPTNVGVGRDATVPVWFGTLLTTGFASLFAASGVALRGVGVEGQRLWMLRVAPIGVRDVLVAKCVSGGAVALGLGLLLILVGAIRLGFGVLETGMAALLMGVVVAGLVGLAVGIGAIRPHLDWTDPRRSVGIGTSLAFIGVGSLYLAAAFSVLAFPYAHHEPGSGEVLAADLVVAVLAAAVSSAALLIGGSRLQALEL